MVDGPHQAEAGHVVAVDAAQDHDDQGLGQRGAPADAVDPVFISIK